MYKLQIDSLKAIKAQLKANNKHLANQPQTSETKKLIKGNEKQISFLEEVYYIE